MKNELRSTILQTPQHRLATFVRSAIDVEKRTVQLAFSSETPVERFWGIEILDHSKGAVDLSRLADGAVLFNHDVSEHHGVVESAHVDKDKVGRATVRFSRKVASEALFQDVQDGILTKVSVGYMIEDLVLEEDRKNQPSVYRATKWAPFEITFTPVPADTSVGVGRTATNHNPSTGARIMSDPKEVKVPTPEEAAALEKIRREEIDATAKQFADRIKGGRPEMGKLVEAAFDLNVPADQFRGDVYTRIVDNKPVEAPETFLDLTNKEKRQYSLLRLIDAMASREYHKAPFEFECSKVLAQRLKKDPLGAFIPFEVQPHHRPAKRDLTAGTTTEGGFSVATDLAGYIDLLWKRTLVVQMGATVLSGLNGNVAIPKLATGSTGYWVAENVAITESDHVFAQVTMTPTTLGAFTDISRRLILQSSLDVENLVRNEITRNLRVELDRVAIEGSGSSSQPTGILNVSGIGDVAGGTNGLAPTWAHVVKLETEVAQDDADFGRMGYLASAKVRGKLKETFRNATYGEIPVWGEGTMPFGSLNGYRAGVSNNMPDDLTKGTSSGVCSAIIFGNWESLLIGEWGIMDILVDPYTGGAAGTVRIRALIDVDLAVRWPQSFAAMLDALTA